MAKLTPNLNSLFLEDLNGCSQGLVLDPNLNNLNSELTGVFQTPLDSAAHILAPHNQHTNGVLGGYPIQLLLMIARLNKILNTKKESVKKLSEMNGEAERLRASNQSLNKEFQMQYALLVLDLERMNKDLKEFLSGVQRFCEEYSIDFASSSQNSSSLLSETLLENGNQTLTIMHDMREKYMLESEKIVNKLNETNSSRKVKSKPILSLLMRLTSLMLQLRDYVESASHGSLNSQSLDDNSRESSTGSNEKRISTFLPFCVRTVRETVQEMKENLLNKNEHLSVFEHRIEVHLNHIESVLCKYNKLNSAFRTTTSVDNNSFELLNDDESN